jgi:hypothetical protein
MSLFIEVESIDKGCKVIINVEHIVEIAPLTKGGCDLFFADGASVGGTRTMKVKDSYALFQQLVMQMVSAEDIQKRFPTKGKTKVEKEIEELHIPKLG